MMASVNVLVLRSQVAKDTLLLSVCCEQEMVRCELEIAVEESVKWP